MTANLNPQLATISQCILFKHSVKERLILQQLKVEKDYYNFLN